MTLEELARVIWVRALEECDPDGDVVRRRVRDRASASARVQTARAESAESSLSNEGGGPKSGRSGRPDELDRSAGESAFLVARANAVLEALEASGRSGLADGWRRATHLPPVWLFIAIGFVAGCLAEGLGARNVNLLAVPLVGLLAWNFALYALELLRALGLGVDAGLRGSSALVEGIWRRLRELRRFGEAAAKLGSFEARTLAHATGEFARQWAASAGAAALRPLRTRLHVAAAGFALGVIAGLYTEGFGFAFRATWESTFLDARAAAEFLAVLLAPATLLGLGAPAEDALRGIQAPANGPAALWIHRWALSLLVWVVLPRLALGALFAWRHRRERELSAPTDEAYFVRLLARRAIAARSARVVPYAGDLSGRAADRLRELVTELFGSRTELQLEAAAEYGDDPPDFSEGPSPEVVVLVFPLAQTPEAEVHGRYVDMMVASLRALPAHPPCIVVLDEERYALSAGEERCEQRRAAWQRVLREVDVAAVSIGIEDRLSDSALEGAARALGRSARGAPEAKASAADANAGAPREAGA